MKTNHRLPFTPWHLPFVFLATLTMCLAALPARAATLVVTNTADSGPGSLRQTISNANSGDTITFTNTLSGSNIVLTSGELLLTNNLTIDASTLPLGITISGNNTYRIFEVATGATNVLLNSLTITNGFSSGNGGGILTGLGSFLTLSNCTLAGNVASAFGGGIYYSGLAFQPMNNCTVSGNTAFRGGGVYVATYLDVNQCTISQNITSGEGGGIYEDQGCIASLVQCTLVSNTAPLGLGGGVYVYEVLNYSNCIIAANSGEDIFLGVWGRGDREGVNIIQSILDTSFYPYTGTGTIIKASPLLAPLGNYGGPTRTMPPLPGSPAIDGCTSGTGFTTDQRGYPRILSLFADIGAVESAYSRAAPCRLTSPTRLGNGSMEFTFTNYSGMSFTVLASTNMALPVSQWSTLGSAVESPPGSGQYSFTDPQASNYPHCFYRVCWP